MGRLARLMLLSVLIAMALQSQSLSITNPAVNDTVGGYGAYSFQVALKSAPSVVKVCYVVDSYPAFNPGVDAATTLGCSITAPFSVPYNSFWNGNGSHQLVATAYDALGRVVATSAAVPFTIRNFWPLSYVAGLSVTTSCPLSSNWTGNSCTLTWTWSGSGAANPKTIDFVIDGLAQNNAATTETSGNFTAKTLQFQNGSHIVCLVGADNVAGTKYTGPGGVYTGVATEWCRTVNFQNGAAPVFTLTNASGIFLAPGKTFTLTAQTLNADGSSTSNPRVFTSSDTAIATVNKSTGMITAVANGTALINATTFAWNGKDLATHGTNSIFVASVTHPFTAQMAGGIIEIAGGAGWTPGSYTITSVIDSWAVLNTPPARPGTKGGQFTAGPNRQSRVYVWPTNTMPHLTKDGQTLTTYDPARSIIPHAVFQSAAYMFYNEQPYTPGAMADINASGFNTLETSILQFSMTGNSKLNEMQYQANVNNWISLYEGMIAGYPKLGFMLEGDTVLDDLYYSTSGGPSRFSIPAFQYAMQQWAARGNVRGVSMVDENAVYYTRQPLAGPIRYSNSSGQSWLRSIAALDGACTASTNAAWSISNGNSGFILHGSAIAHMNNVAPAHYTAKPPFGEAAGSFTFRCAEVPNGRYDASNDPGLILEPMGNAWYNSNTDFIHYDAFASLYAQAHKVPNVFGLSWPIIGVFDGHHQVIANWNANSTQSLGAVTQVADHANIYWPHGNQFSIGVGREGYLVSRLAANSLLQTGDIGYELKTLYGTYNPAVPLIALTQGTIASTGLQGYPVDVASCAGDTITFKAPHGIGTILPGQTRLYISGAKDSGTPANSCNGNFYVYGAPTPTTVTVALAATDFTSAGNTANGGTITYHDGSTLTISKINAAGKVVNCSNATQLNFLCGDVMSASMPTHDMYRMRGQTFTCFGCTGTGASSWNNRTFLLLPENLNRATPFNDSLFYREIPQLSAEGGTAHIVPDNNYHKGYSGSVELGDTNPGWSFGTVMECYINRCAADRTYQMRPYASGYSDQMGFTSNWAPIATTSFGGTALEYGQLNEGPHFENAQTVPVFHALSNADAVLNRYQKYVLQPALNSPDTGQPWIDCAARAGRDGDIVFCFNASDGPQPVTLNLAPYLQSGQQIIQQVVNDHSIGAGRILSAGTRSVSITLQPEDAVFYVFPRSFEGELQQPALAAQLKDVPGATKVVVRYAYDSYYLDSGDSNVFDCGSGVCTPSWDRNFGTVYYRLIYLGPKWEVLATSEIQTL